MSFTGTEFKSSLWLGNFENYFLNAAILKWLIFFPPSLGHDSSHGLCPPTSLLIMNFMQIQEVGGGINADLLLNNMKNSNILDKNFLRVYEMKLFFYSWALILSCTVIFFFLLIFENNKMIIAYVGKIVNLAHLCCH